MRRGGPALVPVGRRGRPPFCPGPAPPALSQSRALSLFCDENYTQTRKVGAGGGEPGPLHRSCCHGNAEGRHPAHAPGRGRAFPGAASPRHISRGRHFVRAAAAPRRRGARPRPPPAAARPRRARGGRPPREKSASHWPPGTRRARPLGLIGRAQAAGGADWLVGEGRWRQGGAAGSHGGAGGAGRAAGAGIRRRRRAVPRAHHRAFLLHHLGRRHLLRERLRGGDLAGLQERCPERGSLRRRQWEAVPCHPGAGRGALPGLLEPGAPQRPVGHLRGEILRRGVLQRPAQGSAQ